ncbi:MAG: hypothetical protein ACRDRV_20965, partial [Pseudonocardiaceae bacterium]
MGVAVPFAGPGPGAGAPAVRRTGQDVQDTDRARTGTQLRRCGAEVCVLEVTTTGWLVTIAVIVGLLVL